MAERSVTELLEAHRLGQSDALDKAFEVVYDELRKLAHFHLKGQGPGKTLNTTSLVHEVYLKIARSDSTSVEDRVHFMALSSRAMRQVVVDYARTRCAAKRGGGAMKVSLDTNLLKVDDQAEWILTIDSALSQIRDIDPRLEQVFECRYFAGFSEDETAEALGVSVRTVQRDWQRSKAWLREALAENLG